MNRVRGLATVALLTAWVSAGPAFAGPIADFETALASAYADYRAALFRTNQNDKAATETALATFETKWTALSARWGDKPPPHALEDAQWRTTLDQVARIAATAKAEAAGGNLTKAHETLEKIRDEVGAMRERNGLVSFSDRMNAYHEAMEAVLLRDDKSFEPAALGRLREQAAILHYLAAEVARHAPAAFKSDPAFGEALTALNGSVAAFLTATRAGDAAATGAAIEKLKPAYSRMFLKFG